MNADGSDGVQLTSSLTFDFEPDWQFGTVPEPGFAVALASGLALLAGLDRKRRRR